jgi:hypothetical protein
MQFLKNNYFISEDTFESIFLKNYWNLYTYSCTKFSTTNTWIYAMIRKKQHGRETNGDRVCVYTHTHRRMGVYCTIAQEQIIYQ